MPEKVSLDIFLLPQWFDTRVELLWEYAAILPV